MKEPLRQELPDGTALGIAEPRVVHVVAPFVGSGSLAVRQELFFASIDQADIAGVDLLAAAPSGWSRPGWNVASLERDARAVGDTVDKPFLRDLFDLANERAGLGDWLLYTNVDCALVPDLYARLRSTRASVVEYMREDVAGDPQTLRALFSNPSQPYEVGLDGLALRAALYRELRELISDFLVGEPHWDTVFSEVLRWFVPVRRERRRLFHPRHPQVWDLAAPTPAGRHNERLFTDALLRGHVTGGRIVTGADRTDTAVVVACFGSDQPLRDAANVTGLRGKLCQDLFAEVYLVELIPEREETRFPPDVLSRVRHVPVRGDESCRGLFQKEALLNLGWKTALEEHPYEYFIFVDADVYSHQLDWFSQIRALLRDDPARAVQGFQIVRDTRDEDLAYCSLGSAYAVGAQTDLPLNPGICWGLHRRVLELGGGMNPYCIDSGGDSAFVAEYLNAHDVQYETSLLEFGWFHEIRRELPFRAHLAYVPVELVHVFHGRGAERNYDAVRYAIDSFPPLSELVELGEEGVLRWRDSGCVEQQLLRSRGALVSRDAVDRRLEELDYSRRARARSGGHESPAKPVFPVGAAKPAPLSLGRPPSVTMGRGIEIFDPAAVYRDEWPFSWCDGIEHRDGRPLAPVDLDRTPPVLLLRRRRDEDAIVLALPLRPSWEPRDVTPFGVLRLSVLAEGPELIDVRVTLSSRVGGNGVEVESATLSLREEGLRVGELCQFALDLGRFDGPPGFARSHTKHVKVVATSCELVELSRIRIE